MAVALPVRVKSQFEWRTVFWLCMLGGMFSGFFKLMDNYILHNRITDLDDITAASAYLIVGGWTGVAVGVIFSLLYGKKVIDPDFSGFTLGNRKMHSLAVITGFITAISTWAILIANTKTDASVIAIYSVLTLIITSNYDVRKNQLVLQRNLWPSFIAILGCTLTAVNKELVFPGIMLLVFLLASNISGAFAEILEQPGSRASDGVNFFVWRFFWLAATGTLMVIATAAVRGHLNLLWETSINAIYSPVTMGAVVLTMLFVYPAVGFKLVAKKRQGVSVSHVFLLAFSMQAAVTAAFTFLGDKLIPGIFGKDVPNDPLVWSIRLTGIFLVLAGIVLLQKIAPQHQR